MHLLHRSVTVVKTGYGHKLEASSFYLSASGCGSCGSTQLNLQARPGNTHQLPAVASKRGEGHEHKPHLDSHNIMSRDQTVR